jgi:peptide/nickel transport system ATP-binding protein
MSKLLEIKNLCVDFGSDNDRVRALDSISLILHSKDTLGIVGESGSGKSVTALSIMQLLPSGASLSQSGEIWFQTNEQNEPRDLMKMSALELQKVRGKDIAMIFQEPMTSLNPVFRCGHQVTEAIQLHQKTDFKTAKNLTLELFKKVKLPDPERIFDAYPHQISGGQKQRVMIAMAMSCNPALLIADEPTTALDVTVQKAILDLLKELQSETGLSTIFISHDLGVIAEVCNRVAVMYKGEIVEEGPVEQVLRYPQHPYTKGLIACRPSLHQKYFRLPTIQDFVENKTFNARVLSEKEVQDRNVALQAQTNILQVKDLSVRFPSRKNWLGKTTEWLQAVNQVSFDISQGETFGLAGESGCGKTTLGRAIARLNEPFQGEIIYKGKELTQLSESEFKPFRKEIQVVFQDPYSSLNPRMSIGEAIEEPMMVHKLCPSASERKEKTIELLETVGLLSAHYERYPHEFSGGQRQRICIARALALEPKFLVCDEMVSALDVSVQATVLNLLMDLQEKFGLTYLFISHDLSVIKQMCDRLMIMNQGRVEALGYADDIFSNPSTEYVERLISSVPKG